MPQGASITAPKDYKYQPRNEKPQNQGTCHAQGEKELFASKENAYS